MRHLFKKVLQFNDVTVHTDLTKAKIIEVLDSVKERAEQFAQKFGDKEVLAVAVINIGFNMVLDYTPHHTLLQERGYRAPPKGTDGSFYEELYALTV